MLKFHFKKYYHLRNWSLCLNDKETIYKIFYDDYLYSYMFSNVKGDIFISYSDNLPEAKYNLISTAMEKYNLVSTAMEKYLTYPVILDNFWFV